MKRKEKKCSSTENVELASITKRITWVNGIAAINAVITIVNIRITMMIALIGMKGQKGD